MFKLVDVSKYYNSNGIVTIALEHINLEFKKGDIVAITGESGSGKSTLLNILCGNDSYDEGEIYFNGNETSYFDNNDLDNFRNKYVGFIYQNYNIIDSYTVLQNVMFPLLIKGVKYKEAKNRALELINKVGLKDRINHKGTKLSGGEKQRVVIARALASDPKILACDEPTGNLDSKTSKEIINLIKEVAKDKLVLIVTHNYDEVKDIATRKVTLVDGKVIEDKILKEVDEKEDKDMILEKQKLSFMNITLFALENVLSTPRKTLFTFIILFIMAFAILSLFKGTTYNFAISTRDQNDSSLFYMKDYKIISNKDGMPLDLNDFKDYTYDDTIYYNKSYQVLQIPYLYYTKIQVPYETLYGKLPEKEGEILLYLSNEKLNDYRNFINRNISISTVSGFKELTITGIAVTKYTKKVSFYSITDLTFDVIPTYNNDFIAMLTNYPDLRIRTRRTNDSKITIVLPISFQNKDLGDLYLKYRDPYILKYDYDVRYENTQDIVAELPNKIFDNVPIFEIAIVLSDMEMNDFISLGYEVYSPYDNSSINFNALLNILVVSLLLLLPVFALLLVSYFAFKTIYNSKAKEYTIMRIIGINKKDMLRIISLETIYISVLSLICAYILNFILGYGFNVLIYKVNSLLVNLIYIFIMTIFLAIISYKFNKKLYDSTIAKTLKEA